MVTYLHEGDKNSKFFYAYAISQRRQSTISALYKEDGTCVDKKEEIAAMFIDHFTEAFTSTTHRRTREESPPIGDPILSSAHSCQISVLGPPQRYLDMVPHYKRTILSIRAASSNFKIQQLPQPWLKVLKHRGQGHVQSRTIIPTVIKWMHPPKGRLKLNVDGAFKPSAEDAGGGGILRDHNGECILAFAVNYKGTTSALDAEAYALRDGLMICRSKGFINIMVETDSLSLMQFVTGQVPSPWELTCVFQEMAETTHVLEAQIQHAPREANQVAHHLASYGCSTDHIRI
ncbi:hypothetical protein Taro_054008 [Colocasia esculenta]|uniref:RNase H type-1 domain-containing protein n=1 Tax=Colocasia esculenta TaxID=4460 RepID=A0A843XMF4_COLES|nr:hypothetical protein [Colocasia esculenta]